MRFKICRNETKILYIQYIYLYCFIDIQGVKKSIIMCYPTAGPKLLEALQMAESYMEKAANFNGKVRINIEFEF